MEDEDPGSGILNSMLEKRDRLENIRGLPDGVIVHVVERSRSFGADAPTLEGNILIEENGQIRRASGQDIALLNDIAPDFLRCWRLSEGD